jgi:glycosidase
MKGLDRPRWAALARSLLLAAAGALVALASGCGTVSPPPGDRAAKDEIFYLIFVRSFRDSNGDAKGDLRGIEDELDYLQGLGVTTILLTPLYESPFYHSYFATDFSKIDPAYGTEADLRHLVRALHRRGMRIFLDEEVQYVTADHEWYRDALNNPNSRFSHFIPFHGPGNTLPESGPYGLFDLSSYDGTKVRVATVNLYDPGVLKYQTRMFEHWMNPDRASADDGVDGFRIDHMMDDLDSRKILVNLFARFWTPIFEKLRAENPRVRILAEQADWGYGDDFLTRGNVDLVYAFPVRGAIASFDKKKLGETVAETWRRTPAGKGQLIFIENHDTYRFASVVGGDLRRERVGAALNLLLKGTPLIYYGQELGMEGRQFRGWNSDANDIPVREAFPWTATVGPGMAVWYRDSGPWWTQSPLAKGGYPSLEAEANDPGSLLAYYKGLIALRRSHPELVSGDQAILADDNDRVFVFERIGGARRTLVAVNLSGAPATARVAALDAAAAPRAALRNTATGETLARGGDGNYALALQPYGVGIFEVSPADQARP